MDLKRNSSVEDLLSFSIGMMNGEDGRKLVEKYRSVLDQVTPYDMIEMEDRQIKMGIQTSTIKRDLDKVINVIFKSLKNFQWEKPKEGHFLYYLMLENSAYEFQLNQIKRLIREYRQKEHSNLSELKEKLLKFYLNFQEFDLHYLKEQNILFPYLEKHWKHFRPLRVMWSLQDDIRESLKKMIDLLSSEHSTHEEIYHEIGVYYFLVIGMIQKENLVVYPVAYQTLPEEDWEEMFLQSFEYGFPMIEAPQQNPKQKEAEKKLPQEGKLVSETGELDPDQVLLLINALPLDITFVDEEDRVRFFSRPKERFFPRSPAIIGRKVQQCHPPESIETVETILSAFKKGIRDKAEFWIHVKEKFVFIRYFALRDAEGKYRGVLEVSQDIDEIRSLTGEKRLLDWK